MFQPGLTSILLLFIPLINFSFIIIFESSAVPATAEVSSFTAIISFFSVSSLLVLALFLYNRMRRISIVLISIICFIVPAGMLMTGTDSIKLQTAVVLVSLFLLLYTLSYREKRHEGGRTAIRGIIIHVCVCLLLVVASVKFSLLSVFWNRLSITVYFILIVLSEWRFSSGKLSSGKKGFVISRTLFLALLTLVFFLFPLFSYFCVFIILLFILWKYLRIIHYDKELVTLLFENPFKLFIVSFALIILVGTILLSMPFASVTGKSISLINAFFTATSATCVTGLVVLDTGTDFTFAGQAVILTLIQVGGIGIVTIMTFVSILLGQTIGFTREFIISDIVGSRRPAFVRKLIKFIVLGTASFELAGAVILTSAFYASGNGIPEALWKGIFHSVSAFCNAGFALQADSLVGMNSSGVIILTVSFLVIIGGTGFPVIAFIKELVTGNARPGKAPVSIRASIIATVVLLLSGYVLFYMFEYDNSFRDMPELQKHLNAFFMSVTPRTAGFNSVSMNGLTDVSLILHWLFMFIGAGTGSTAGGIKITTVSVLWAAMASYLKGQEDVTLFRKTIPADTVRKSMLLLSASLMLIFVFILIIRLTHDITLKQTIFEVLSAYGTVGLSIDATGLLSDFGKFMISILMFTGRVGILTILSLVVSPRASKIRYPHENVLIG